MRNAIMCFVWYRKEDYPRFLDICDDASNLPDTYDDWFTKTENEFIRVEADGQRAYKVEIRPDDLVAFCQRNKISRIDQHARTGFANHILGQHISVGDIKLDD